VGVSLASRLERDRVVIRRDGTYELGPRAEARLAALGVELSDLQRLRRPVVRGCLDWSERELHVAAGIGAALAVRLFELGWIQRHEGDRSVEVTAEGRAALDRELGIDLDVARAA
jgi:hypothetical protein